MVSNKNYGEIRQRRELVAEMMAEHAASDAITKRISEATGIPVGVVQSDVVAIRSGKALADAEKEESAPTRDELKAHRMHLAGYPAQEIAEVCSIPVERVITVCDFVAKWKDGLKPLTIEQVKRNQVERLEAVSEMALRVFHESRSDAEILTESEKDSDENGTTLEKKKVTKGRDGSPEFLELYRKCQADIRKIIGAEAPAKTAFTGADGEGPVEINISVLTPEQRRKLADVQDIIDNVEFERIE